MRRQTQNHSQAHIDQSDDDCTTSSPSQILERVQSDRVTLTKPEEDRRRRTIIVEKKNGTFGFTIQSYGIHYKKEKEIEMITYVDYVDYDGPAYRAGMREGDVILSINGTDMEKADHKTLVNYIKNCEARMRMVVLFEDCVRKVELHMRYIKLQSILECKMEELERLCIRERQLLEGKWKTHSLPARKKASQTNSSGPPTPTQTSYSYCRPTVSTEDVAKVAQQQKHQTPPLVFAYQYLDSSYRYMLQPSTSSSGEYLLSFEPQARQYKEPQNFIIKTSCELPPKHQNSTSSRPPAPHQNHHQNTSNKSNNGSVEKHRSCHSYGGHLCNPCIRSANSNNGDNTSLEAYDLASPCCDPHCVPSSRRRSRTPKDTQHRKRESKTEETQTDPQPSSSTINRSRGTTHSNSVQHQQAQTYNTAPKRYFHFGAGLVSQCSLHSCTSSEISNVVPTTTGESSNNSYTTSLSTDTLYWDDVNNSSTRQLTSGSTNKIKHDRQGYPAVLQHQPCSYTETVYVPYNPPAKPKSWDNLTTKAFGGYGFGYGYFDSSTTKYGHKSTKLSAGSNRAQTMQYVRVDSTNKPNGLSTGSSNNSISMSSTNQPQYTPHTQRRYFQANKSTESLLSVPKYSSEALSDSSLSCECIEAASPLPDVSDGNRFFQSPRQSVVSPTDPNFGYYSVARSGAARTDYAKKVVSTSSEATRL